MQFLHFSRIYIVKSLHNLEATDFFIRQIRKKAKYVKTHIVGSLKNQTYSNECVYKLRIIDFTL